MSYTDRPYSVVGTGNPPLPPEGTDLKFRTLFTSGRRRIFWKDGSSTGSETIYTDPFFGISNSIVGRATRGLCFFVGDTITDSFPDPKRK